MGAAAAVDAGIDGATRRGGRAVSWPEPRPCGASPMSRGVRTATRGGASPPISSSTPPVGVRLCPTGSSAAGARRPVEELEDMGFVYYGRHFRSRRRHHAADHRSAPAGLRQRVDPDAARRQRHVGGGGDRQRRRQGHAGAARTPSAGRALVAQPAPGRTLARRRASRRQRHGHGQDRGPSPHLHRGRCAGGDGLAAVADSWACTNPSLGRGATSG